MRNSAGSFPAVEKAFTGLCGDAATRRRDVPFPGKTEISGISHIIDSQFTRNVSGSLGGAISNLGTTTLYGTSVRFNTGSSAGGIATGNTNVTLKNSTVTSNTPDNCSPLNTIQGCVN